MAKKIDKVSIKFKAGAYGAYRSMNNKVWYALAEFVDNALQRLSPNGQIQGIDVTSISGGQEELAYSELAVSREGLVFFGAVQTSNQRTKALS